MRQIPESPPRIVQVLQLRGKFQEAQAACLADPEGDIEEVKGIARLWVEVGEAYSSLIATGGPCQP